MSYEVSYSVAFSKENSCLEGRYVSLRKFGGSLVDLRSCPLPNRLSERPGDVLEITCSVAGISILARFRDLIGTGRGFRRITWAAL